MLLDLLPLLDEEGAAPAASEVGYALGRVLGPTAVGEVAEAGAA